jgi:hypothetical protein
MVVRKNPPTTDKSHSRSGSSKGKANGGKTWNVCQVKFTLALKARMAFRLKTQSPIDLRITIDGNDDDSTPSETFIKVDPSEPKLYDSNALIDDSCEDTVIDTTEANIRFPDFIQELIYGDDGKIISGTANVYDKKTFERFLRQAAGKPITHATETAEPGSRRTIFIRGCEVVGAIPESLKR